MKFNQAIANYKNLDSFPHAMLIESLGCNDYQSLIKSYLKALICNENIYCDNCISCQRINENKFVDLLIVDCSRKMLSKEDVDNIQSFCFSAPFEKNNIKLYAIINIENNNKESINSLLKTIEEPKDNIYALFFCKNQNSVIKTITSRCQKITITNENKFNDEFINYCFNSVDEYHEFCNNNDIAEIKSFFNNLVHGNDVLLQSDFIQMIKSADNFLLNIYIKIIAFYSVIEKRLKIHNLVKHLNLNINKILLGYKILNILEK